MSPFRRHDMVTCGFLASGIGVTVGMYGLVDIGSSLVRVLYMRVLSGAKVLTVGYCNPVAGAKTIDNTTSVVSTIIGTAIGMTIVKAIGMTTEDTKIVDSLQSCMAGRHEPNGCPAALFCKY